MRIDSEQIESTDRNDLECMCVGCFKVSCSQSICMLNGSNWTWSSSKDTLCVSIDECDAHSTLLRGVLVWGRWMNRNWSGVVPVPEWIGGFLVSGFDLLSGRCLLNVNAIEHCLYKYSRLLFQIFQWNGIKILFWWFDIMFPHGTEYVLIEIIVKVFFQATIIFMINLFYSI